MAFVLEDLFAQAVEVDEQTAKARLAAAPQREGGGWVKPVLERFNADQRAYLWLPVSAFPRREGAGEPKPSTIAQNLNSNARELGLNVKARALPNEETNEKGIMLTHEYPEKSNRGRPAGSKNGETTKASKSSKAQSQ